MEVVMKTQSKILTIAAIALLLGSCSSGMQMSRTSKYQSDDVYFNPSASYSTEQSSTDAQNRSRSKSELKLTELEKKYADILANDTIGEIDTVIYKADKWANPYERVMSDSYEESYERRLRGRTNPYYRVSSLGAFYNDDYWYASAFRGDPYYNIIVMGTDIWVEPYYISSMFGWPYRSTYRWHSPFYRSHWGFGMGMYSPYYHWGFGHSAWSSYAWGYGAGYGAGYWHGYHWGSETSTTNYHYGRRPTSGPIEFDGRTRDDKAHSASINQVRQDLSQRQVTFSNESGRDRQQASASVTRTQNNRIAQQDPQRENVASSDRQVIVREPVRNAGAVSRTSREGMDINPTRVASPDKEMSTRPTREHNPSYTRPNPGNTNEFNRPTRGYPSTEAVRAGDRANRQVAPPTRTSTGQQGTYNPPPRGTRSPATTQPTGPTRSSGNVSRPSSGSSVGRSSTPARSSGSSVGRSTSPSRSSGASSGASRSTGSSSSSSSSSAGNSRSR